MKSVLPALHLEMRTSCDRKIGDGITVTAWHWTKYEKRLKRSKIEWGESHEFNKKKNLRELIWTALVVKKSVDGISGGTILINKNKNLSKLNDYGINLRGICKLCALLSSSLTWLTFLVYVTLRVLFEERFVFFFRPNFHWFQIWLFCV